MYKRKVIIMRSKKVRKIAVWIMTILMIASVVASILVYYLNVRG